MVLSPPAVVSAKGAALSNFRTSTVLPPSSLNLEGRTPVISMVPTLTDEARANVGAGFFPSNPTVPLTSLNSMAVLPAAIFRFRFPVTAALRSRSPAGLTVRGLPLVSILLPSAVFSSFSVRSVPSSSRPPAPSSTVLSGLLSLPFPI